MQRFLNDPNDMVDEYVDAYLMTHPLLARAEDNPRVVYRKDIADKVGIVSGGGSGHEPSFLGYLRPNMLDAAAVGEIFASPTPLSFLDAFRKADHGHGVACLFGNYSGDMMNAKAGMLMAKDEGIDVKYVVSKDDIASAPADMKDKRHGIAGLITMWIAGGQVAIHGGDVDAVCQAATEARDNTRSVCVGLHELTIPAVGHPNFHIPDGEYEFGIGHHGESGIRNYKMQPADGIAKRMTDALVEDLGLKSGDEVFVMVSGLGATPLAEQYIMYRAVHKILADQGIKVAFPHIGNLATSLNMNGIALTIEHLTPNLKKWTSAFEAKGTQVDGL
ncbi:MAG: dihydroxyacetone kinase subunit DhaK [Lactobacillus sp.]|jgi:dihydroxyacetone kinase-like protein|nr:dihydroxyacetone kinase subunit DhaK [Lactobacillus sp.]MCI1467166.1 dihydroxyacetone kinase subunit DhaK [Lactobacillus sp.]MCI1481949.1 dihydroxyacetone kinase subunit DhaK [Lactobacillus sp.]MCI1884124.1 dihydroxyacetone kinase subunit DhaK [Lactobacillus sp.]MCI1943409.1 dihydroxyacetone kinase subunit DhaK [Lactobacillus sp.]